MVVYDIEKLGIKSAREILIRLLRVTPNLMSSLSNNIIGKLVLVIDEIDKIEVEHDIITIYCKIDGNTAVIAVSDEIKINY